MATKAAAVRSVLVVRCPEDLDDLPAARRSARWGEDLDVVPG